MTQITKIASMLKQIHNMPYYRNYQALSGSTHNTPNHENALEDVFIGNGLVKGNFADVIPICERVSKHGKPLTPKPYDRSLYSNDLLNGLQWNTIPDNTYYSQPLGQNNNPDFIFKMDNVVYFMECKSTKESCYPVYNSALPKDNYIYVFCIEKSNTTSVYLGSEIVTPDIRLRLDKFNKAADKLVRELNSDLELLDNPKGLSYYLRSMYTHKGGKEVTNYSDSKFRAKSFNNVLEFVQGGTIDVGN